MELESAYTAVAELVKNYEAHRSLYRSNNYSEAAARHDFIDRFLIALGWDVTHETQKNPFQQEVKVERNVKDGDAKRRADYAFYIAPNYRDVRLFVEAKRPGI